MQGFVKWFSGERGYGFIAGQDGTDYFFHYTGIDAEGFRTLDRDDDVEFDIEEYDENKIKAVNIKRGCQNECEKTAINCKCSGKES